MNILKNSFMIAAALSISFCNLNAMQDDDMQNERAHENLRQPPKNLQQLVQYLKTSPETASTKAWILINTSIDDIYNKIDGSQLGSLFKKVTGDQNYGKGNTTALRLQLKALESKFDNVKAGAMFMTKELKAKIKGDIKQITAGWSKEHKAEFEGKNILENIQEFLGHWILQKEVSRMYSEISSGNRDYDDVNGMKNGYNIQEPRFK